MNINFGLIIDEVARCKTLPKRPRHGMVIAPRIEHGTKALFRCKDGYQLNGSNVTMCLYGNWTDVMPICEESESCKSINE